jgi:hypothetical protein
MIMPARGRAMPKTQVAKKKPPKSSALKKTASKKKSSVKTKRRRGLSNDQLRKLMETNGPPQSWYEEDHAGLY